MIHPDEIRRKAERLYAEVLRAILNHEPFPFPHVLRASKSLDNDDPEAAEAVRQLRSGSKKVRGFGYSIDWRERRSRRFGRNLFPERIYFETRDDLLRLVGKQQEFEQFVATVDRLRGEFPVLESWMRTHVRLLIDLAAELDGLLAVTRYFRESPRPNRFPRELPLPVDTKFIERHQRVLGDWFDLVLPPDTIRADEKRFEKHYGLRYAEPHLPIRLLDPGLLRELGFPRTLSLLMDVETLERWRHLAISWNGSLSELPPHLTDAEAEACRQCRDQRLRLEQERLPQEYLLARLAAGTENRPSSTNSYAT